MAIKCDNVTSKMICRANFTIIALDKDSPKIHCAFPFEINVSKIVVIKNLKATHENHLDTRWVRETIIRGIYSHLLVEICTKTIIRNIAFFFPPWQGVLENIFFLFLFLYFAGLADSKKKKKIQIFSKWHNEVFVVFCFCFFVSFPLWWPLWNPIILTA